MVCGPQTVLLQGFASVHGKYKLLQVLVHKDYEHAIVSVIYTSQGLSFDYLFFSDSSEPVGYPAITVNRNQTASRGSSVDVVIAVDNGGRSANRSKILKNSAIHYHIRF